MSGGAGGARARGVFVLRFLLLFAGLATLGFWLGVPQRYGEVLRVAGSLTCPLLNGWTLERRAAAADGLQQVWFRRGNDQLRLAIGLEQMALSLLPLLALLGATPGLGPAGVAARAAIGVAALFLLDLLVIWLFPWLVGSPGPTTDILGTFLGLLTFVGGPVILWFALTYDRLRDVWRLS
ncbi:MAG: hypothetical protein SF182_29900 [Deltaproteobacteria bacterium]|nr:hypothetical protein [Deltaproteobacteria bacterium]